MTPPAPDLPSFDLKSSTWTLTVLRLHTADAQALGVALAACSVDSPGLFDHEPVVIDLAALAADDLALDVPALLTTLREQGLLPVAVQGGSAAQMADALQAGLPEAAARMPRSEAAASNEGGAARQGEAQSGAIAAAAAAAAATTVDDPDASPPADAALRVGGTLVVDTPLRSGQRVYARGADLVVLSAVSFGAEVIADGSIHVYGPLRGRAIAGASGDASARIFSTGMDPQLVSIAGIYRTTEDPFPQGVQGQPAQVRLEGERIVIEPIRL